LVGEFRGKLPSPNRDESDLRLQAALLPDVVCGIIGPREVSSWNGK